MRLEHTEAGTDVALLGLWVDVALDPVTVRVRVIVLVVCETDTVSCCNNT